MEWQQHKKPDRTSFISDFGHQIAQSAAIGGTKCKGHTRPPHIKSTRPVFNLEFPPLRRLSRKLEEFLQLQMDGSFPISLLRSLRQAPAVYRMGIFTFIFTSALEVRKSGCGAFPLIWIYTSILTCTNMDRSKCLQFFPIRDVCFKVWTALVNINRWNEKKNAHQGNGFYGCRTPNTRTQLVLQRLDKNRTLEKGVALTVGDN